jgi:alpha,alpha-trehalose phosphorylase
VHGQDEAFLSHEPWDFTATGADGYPLLLHVPYLQLYRRQVVKQPDLVLALVSRGDAFTDEQKRRDFAYYEALTVRDSSLSASTQAIVAAELGHLELAHAYLGEAALMDLDDLEHNAADGLHIASLAGAVLAATAGLGGLRDHDGRLSFAPRLPPGLERLAFGVRWRGARLAVEVRPREVTYAVVEGEAATVWHCGERLELRPGAPVTRDLVLPPRPEPVRQPPGREPAPRGPAYVRGRTAKTRPRADDMAGVVGEHRRP